MYTYTSLIIKSLHVTLFKILNQPKQVKHKNNLNIKTIYHNKKGITFIKSVLRKRQSICKENKIGFYVWSWQNEIPNRLLTAGKFGNAEEYFVKIEYEGKEYISFNDILKQNDNLPLNLTRTFSKYGSTDGHPSLLFNEILCDSLFKKLGVNND